MPCGRLISYTTYKKYAEKYNIDTKSKTGNQKSMKTLQKAIYDYETKAIKQNSKFKGLYYV